MTRLGYQEIPVGKPEFDTPVGLCKPRQAILHAINEYPSSFVLRQMPIPALCDTNIEHAHQPSIVKSPVWYAVKLLTLDEELQVQGKKYPILIEGKGCYCTRK